MTSRNNKSEINPFDIILGEIDLSTVDLDEDEREIAREVCRALEKNDIDRAENLWSNLDKLKVGIH